MEKRAILAAVLMAGLLMVYQFLFIPQEPKKAPPAPAGQSAQAPGPAKPAESPTSTAAPIPLPPPLESPRPADRIVTVETPLYRAVISSVGGAVNRWDLHYRGDKPMVLPGVVSSLGLVILRPGQAPRPIAF